MGKKGHGKGNGKTKAPIKDNTSVKKLSPQKRNELNKIIDKLLKVSSKLSPGLDASKEWDSHLEIRKLLEQVQILETGMKVISEGENERGERLKELLQWMREQGAEINGIRPSQFPGYGWGLQAERDLKEGELVVAVPRRLMLSSENVERSLLGSLLVKDPMLQHMPHVALSLLLLVEKFSPSSFWKPYIISLPTSYNTVLYFSTQELQELKGSPSFDPALKHCRNIARQYAYFSKLFQNTSDPASELLRDVFTYEEYRWAVSTIMTRHNQIPTSESSTSPNSGLVSALIPFWDLGNHADDGLRTEFDTDLQRSECRIGSGQAALVSAGSQVLLRYGQRPSSELLLHGGWAPPPGRNPHDRLALHLGLARADPLWSMRTQLLHALSLPASGEFMLRHPSLVDPEVAGSETTDPLDPPLRAFLRVFAMHREHLERWLLSDRVTDLLHPDCALDTAVETRAWAFFATRMQLLLSCYPTTLQEDLALLDGSSLSPCARLAVTLRASEKMLLSAAREYATPRIHP